MKLNHVHIINTKDYLDVFGKHFIRGAMNFTGNAAFLRRLQLFGGFDACKKGYFTTWMTDGGHSKIYLSNKSRLKLSFENKCQQMCR